MFAAGGAGRRLGVVPDGNDRKEPRVANDFKRGDRVEWSFRGRAVRGTVRRKITKRTEIAGRVVGGSKDDPRYLVRSGKTGKETTRRAQALRRVSD
jgi:hypothetical protein